MEDLHLIIWNFYLDANDTYRYDVPIFIHKAYFSLFWLFYFCLCTNIAFTYIRHHRLEVILKSYILQLYILFNIRIFEKTKKIRKLIQVC